MLSYTIALLKTVTKVTVISYAYSYNIIIIDVLGNKN